MTNRPAGELIHDLAPSVRTTPAGRPDKFDSQRRTVRFLELVAEGMSFREAARVSGVKPERALDLVQDRDALEQQVRALRTEVAGGELHGAEPGQDTAGASRRRAA